MKVKKFDIEGLLLLTAPVYRDERGFFTEAFNLSAFERTLGCEMKFVQDNFSRSVRSVIRGLHYQVAPVAQGKLVQCLRGTIYDVALDMRQSSPTFGQTVAISLSEGSGEAFWIPPGFAHGFCAVSDVADVLYKVTNFYSPSHERSVHWNDPNLKIRWPFEDVVLSPKDGAGANFSEATYFP